MEVLVPVIERNGEHQVRINFKALENIHLHSLMCFEVFYTLCEKQ